MEALFRARIGETGTTSARGIRQKGNLFPLRTMVWAGTSPSPLNPPKVGKEETAEGREGDVVEL